MGKAHGRASRAHGQEVLLQDCCWLYRSLSLSSESRVLVQLEQSYRRCHIGPGVCRLYQQRVRADTSAVQPGPNQLEKLATKLLRRIGLSCTHVLGEVLSRNFPLAFDTMFLPRMVLGMRTLTNFRYRVCARARAGAGLCKIRLLGYAV